MTETYYPRLATLEEFVRITAHDDSSSTWPPPGFDEHRSAFPELWTILSGSYTGDGPETIYHTDLAHMAALDGTTVEVLVKAQGLVLQNPILTAVASIGQYPVVWTPQERPIMKWIRSTFRGDLTGGAEQFQFKLDWGNPGADPTLGEAEAGAFAGFLRDQWSAIWLSSINSNVVQSFFPTDVKWNEVGVAQWQQDSPKNADGSGGDAHQVYPNAWAAWTVGAQPAGTSTFKALPYEVSCAVTLHSNKRGPRGRGRLYLPPFATSAMDPLGVFQTGTVTTMGAAIGDLIEAVQGSTYGYDALVVSMREKVLNSVTSVSVGKVPDSQRRRRRNQDEARVVAWSQV